MKQQRHEDQTTPNDAETNRIEPPQSPELRQTAIKTGMRKRAVPMKPKFLPDKNELELLAEHYSSFLLDEEVAFWELRSICLGEINVINNASDRLDRIRRILGDVVLDRIWQATEQRMMKRLGNEAWQEFCDWRAEDLAQSCERQRHQLCSADE